MVVGEVEVEVDNLGAVLEEPGLEAESHLCHPQEDLCSSFGQL